MNRLITSTLMLLTLSAGAATLAHAQTTTDTNPPVQSQPAPQHHAPDPAHQTKMLTHRLNLTPDQAAQVQPILTARDQQMEALHQSSTTDPKTMHKQMRSIQQDTDAKLNAIFNDQQKQTYAQLEAERRQHGQHAHPDATQPSATPTPAAPAAPSL